ncbi:MAG: YbjN domain-containing protein [Coleofasciculus sp. D1-CHI-01]|uniref:YbjN domain-containing protein n=1 Tax=Coleofasciculus sp. D1-CHI-01 TaxID=3068482 RepID=UPI0032FE6C9F
MIIDAVALKVMIPPHTETHALDSQLTLYDSSQVPLTIHTITLTLTTNNSTLIDFRFTFQIPPELYQRIDTEALFNLKPELRGSLSHGEFFSEPNIEITATLKPDLLPHLTPHLDDPLTYIKSLSQEQPNHPLLSTESWLALQVKQQRDPVETGYRTFWDYLPPSAMNADTMDSEKINEAIFNFFKDWTDANLSTMGTEAISQALDEVAKGFEEWVDTNLSSITEESITPILEEMVNAFEQLADASQFEDNTQDDSSPQIFDTVIKFFTDDDWSFAKVQGEPTLRMLFQGKNGTWTCYARTRVEQSQFVFYSICPVKAPKPKRRALGEFIARANYGMIIGNFELDFTDGEIRYKTSIDVEGSTLTFPLLKRLVYTNVMMMDNYLPGIDSVVKGEASPEDAIAQIEAQTD